MSGEAEKMSEDKQRQEKGSVAGMHDSAEKVLEDRVGIFLCNCNKSINIDLKKIARRFKEKDKEFNFVKAIEIVDKLCTEDGMAYIVDDWRRKKLNKFFIAACDEKAAIFENFISSLGFDAENSLKIVNIRELCGWVHANKKHATEKAWILIEYEFDKEKAYPEEIEIGEAKDIVILGDLEAIKLANEIKKFDVKITAISEKSFIEKNCKLCLQANYCSPEKRACLYKFEFPVLVNTEIKTISGSLGSFEIELREKKHVDPFLCISCDACLHACEKKAIFKADNAIFKSYVIKEDACNNCKACLKVCPTNAIELKENERKIKAKQIISFYELSNVVDGDKEGIYVIKQGKSKLSRLLPEEIYKLSYESALRALFYLKSVKREKIIETEKKLCSNNRLSERKKLGVKGCTHCMETCKYGAIKDGVIDYNLCHQCTACFGVCPQGVIKIKNHEHENLLKEIEGFGKANIKPKLLLLACSNCGAETLYASGERKLKYAPAILALVDCLGMISDLLILRAFDLGFDGIFMLGCNAGKCLNKGGFKNAVNIAEECKLILSPFEIEKERIKVLGANPEKPETFVKAMNEFGENVRELGDIKLKKKQPLNYAEIDPMEVKKRDAIIALLKSFDEKLGRKENEVYGRKKYFPFGYIEVDESRCTLCGACASLCSTGAILAGEDERNQEGWIPRVVFQHSYCTACKICESVCVENAINIANMINYDEFINKTRKEVKVNLIYCEVCGVPIMSERGYEKLNKELDSRGLYLYKRCRDCRDKLLVSEMLGIDESEVRIFEQGKMFGKSFRDKPEI